MHEGATLLRMAMFAGLFLALLAFAAFSLAERLRMLGAVL